MKIDPRRLAPALLLTLALASSGCVAQTRYDEALTEIQYYQRKYQDLESFHGQLEAENARLKGMLELHDGKPLNAAATQEIDQRLEELKRITEGIGAAPGDVTVIPVEGGYGVRVADTVLFDSGSTEIKPDGREVLQRVAQEISTRPYRRIWVRGHTDNVPVSLPATKQRFPHGNLQLSAARAIEVAVFLGQNGLSQDRVVVAGFGPSDPVVPNTSAENKSKNRRVEIFVLEDSSDGGN